jgi:hypothetical protein
MNKNKKRTDAEDETVTAEDLRQQFQALAGGAQESATAVRNRALVMGTGVMVVLLIVVFLLGRRRGHKSTTIVEIVRV